MKFNFSGRYPSEASFFTAQCSTPYPPGSQVCLSRWRFPIIPTNFGLVWAGVTWNKGPIVWTLIGTFRSIQWAISWHVKKKYNFHFIIKAMFTLCWVPFAPARKSYQIGLLFRHKKGGFGTISVTEQSSATPILKVECHISEIVLM